MKTYLRKLVLMTVAIALSGSSLAMADDFRDHNYKGWNSLYLSSKSHSTSRSFRSNAPMSVRSESTPTEVAQAPTNDRTYSYEPSQQSDSSSGCAKNGDNGQSSKVAEQPAQTQRSYSYEPSSNGPVVGRSYSAGHGGSSYERAMRSKGY